MATAGEIDRWCDQHAALTEARYAANDDLAALESKSVTGSRRALQKARRRAAEAKKAFEDWSAENPMPKYTPPEVETPILDEMRARIAELRGYDDTDTEIANKDSDTPILDEMRARIAELRCYELPTIDEAQQRIAELSAPNVDDDIEIANSDSATPILDEMRALIAALQ
jgi:hypothetical protein